MSTKPLISVLIPAYNHEKYVEECVLSIINQTYENLELLILDDGSNDSTYEIIKSLEQICTLRFKRFIFSTQSNKGIIDTTNTLIYKSSGDYIYLIASDDIAKPNAIDTLFLNFDDDTVLAVGNNDIIDSKSNKVSWGPNREILPYESGYKTFWDYLVSTRPELAKLEKFGTYETLLKGNYIPNGYLLRKSTILAIGGYSKNAPLEDFYLHLQLSKHGKFHFIDKILFSYRWHDSNTIKNPKMGMYLKQTLMNEEKLAKNSTDVSILEAFQRATTSVRYYLRLPFFSIERRKNFRFKQVVLVFFGKEFLLYKKDLSTKY